MHDLKNPQSADKKDDIFDSLLAKKSSVLAFGCNKNGFLPALAAHENADITGVDASSAVLEEAKPLLRRAVLCNESYADWSDALGEELFDLIVFSDIPDSVSEPLRLFKCAKKHLKDEGRIFFGVLDLYEWSESAQASSFSSLGREDIDQFLTLENLTLKCFATVEDAFHLIDHSAATPFLFSNFYRYVGVAAKAEEATLSEPSQIQPLRYITVSFYDENDKAFERSILQTFSFSPIIPQNARAVSLRFYGYAHSFIQNCKIDLTENARFSWDGNVLIKANSVYFLTNNAAFHASHTEALSFEGLLSPKQTDEKYVEFLQEAIDSLKKQLGLKENDTDEEPRLFTCASSRVENAANEVLLKRMGIAENVLTSIVISDKWQSKKHRSPKNRVPRIPVLITLKKAFLYFLKHGFRMTLRKIKDRLTAKKIWKKKVYTAEDFKRQSEHIFPEKHVFSILVPLYNTPERFLAEMIDSVVCQTYPHWELCLADGSDEKHASVGSYCVARAEKDPRIKYKKLEKNLGISENTNACIDMASGDFIALFDHDDILHRAALYEFMVAICEKGADFVYTDEATFESPKLKKIVSIHHKPDYALDTLRANNYICHFSTFSREVLNKAGKFRKAFDGSQDHDMILRLTECAKRVVHIPKILYYWRSHPLSVAMDINSKTYAIEAGRAAVKESLLRAGMQGTVDSSRVFPTIYRIFYDVPQKEKVSIIITNQKRLLEIKRCIDSILTLTTYPDFEIIVVDPSQKSEELRNYYEKIEKKNGVKVLSPEEKYDYCRLNNLAVASATGKYLLFLNSAAKIITPAWIEEMMMYAQRDDVGAVGGMIYYPDNTIRHAGMILNLGKDHAVGYPFRGCKRLDVGYMGRLGYSQDLSAVSSACLLMKKDLFLDIGGFDEGYSVNYYDADLCLKAREKGLYVVWTPHAEIYRFFVKDDRYTKQTNEKDLVLFKEKWAKVLEKGDPYYNPNFSLDRTDFWIN